VGATLDEVAEMAMAFPDVIETVGGHTGRRTWTIASAKKFFAWERPFSKADIKRFGKETPPDGDILAVRVDDLHEKEAMLASGKKGFFTTPHFDGYPSVLIQLKVVTKRDLRNALTDGWLAVAPPKLAEEYLAAKKRR
jgi:hypothetical protein